MQVQTGSHLVLCSGVISWPGGDGEILIEFDGALLPHRLFWIDGLMD
jgi:hypothetical protein